MATNTLLNPTVITRRALRTLHQKLNFLSNVNKQYDDKFKLGGAKAGTTIGARLPNKYNVRTTATASYNDVVDRSTPIVMTSQYGVDVSFTSVELTMNIDDFNDKVLDPAMSQLASTLEGTALAKAYKLVPNYVGTTSTSLTFLHVAQAGSKLADALAPRDNSRYACFNPTAGATFSDNVKGLFHDAENIKEQYKEGLIGRTSGFNMYENTLVPGHTMGTLAGSPVTSGAANATTTTATTWVSQTDVSITGATSATTIKAGDILTFGTVADGFVDCHPETKATYGRLKTFVVQSDVTLTTAATNYTVTVKPGIMVGSGNAYQNAIMTGADTSGLTVTNWGAAGSSVGQSLLFHKDAFAFVTADLEDVSQYGAWGARDVMDGISMRIGRQWDVANDRFPCRIDVLWGFDGLYAPDGFAVRHINTP
jgi:hypothetical protein